MIQWGGEEQAEMQVTVLNYRLSNAASCRDVTTATGRCSRRSRLLLLYIYRPI